MSGQDPPTLNPYAPTQQTESDYRAAHDFPESGVSFSGELVLQSVRRTRTASLTIGLVIALAFTGLLLAGVLTTQTRPEMVVLSCAVAFTLLALLGFIYGQSERPLLKYRWMEGLTTGHLTQHRLDISWNDGRANGSFLFRGRESDRDFQNNHGRMFVLRHIPCFIPRQAVASDQLTSVNDFCPELPHDIQPSKSLLRDVPAAAPNAFRWKSAEKGFFDDQRRHDFVCAPPALSRLLFFIIAGISILLVVDGGRVPSITMLLCLAALVMCGIFWLGRVGTQLHWGFRFVRPTLGFHAKSYEFAPPLERWMDSNGVLVAYFDAWICVPWEAIQKAVISPHAIELRVTPLGIDRWYLERGDRDERQWRAVVDHVQFRVASVSIWGAARKYKQV